MARRRATLPANRYYFAYGSNLNAADLAHYCDQRGISPDVLRAKQAAWLLDHRPVYHYRSPTRGGGALDVLPKRGHLTPGVLFAVAPEGWTLLDRKEGAPRRYARQPVYAVDTNGGLFQAITYRVTSAHQRQRHVPPKATYTELVEEGLRSHGLPIAQHAQVVRGDQPSPMVRHLFISEILQSVDALDALLPAIHAGRPARMRWGSSSGRADPAWQPLGTEDDWCRGKLLSLDDPEAVLAETDQIAGWSGSWFSASSARVLVEVLDAGGEPVLAWCYRASRAVDAPLAFGARCFSAARLNAR